MTRTISQFLEKLEISAFARIPLINLFTQSILRYRPKVLVTAHLIAVILFSNFASAQYTTNWLGNSGAQDDLYVQQELHTIWVAPEGTTYGYSWYDEINQRIRLYSTSGQIGMQFPNMPYGSDLAGNTTKLFATEVNRVTAVLRTDGSKAATITVPGNFVNGIIATETEVFVSSQNGNVYVYNDDLAVVRNFNVGVNPGRMAIDGAGFLWVITGNAGLETGNTVLKRFSTTGSAQSQSISFPSSSVDGVAIASSIAINTVNNTIYIVDRGTDQNIKVFTNITSSPTRGADFGVVGGIFSGSRPGLVGPLRFHFNAVPNGDTPGHIVNYNGVGVDNTGNIYVLHGVIAGAHIEKYSPTSIMQWRLNGHTFEEGALIDPTTDEMDVYAGAHHYKMNYSAAPNTDMATWYGNLAARNQSNSYNTTERGIAFQGQSPVRIANIFGKKFMWSMAQKGELYVYRMDPNTEILANVGITDNENLTTWTRGGINDVDATGAMWSGDILGSIEKHICTGVTAAGVPIYNFNSPTVYTTPAPYTGQLVDIKYNSVTDVMYLSDSAKTTRYNNWSTSRTLVWTKDFRLKELTAINLDGQETQSMDIAGDYIFTDYFGGFLTDITGPGFGLVKVWNANTGNFVMNLKAPANYRAGDSDNNNNTKAYKRSNGEYIITFLDHYKNKTIVFRWIPGTLPLNLSSFTALINNRTNKLSWVTLNETNFKHFEVEKSADAINFTQFNLVDSKGNGNYSTTDNAPFNGNNYYRLKMVDLDGQYEYSQTIVVKNPLKNFEYTIFPNPAKDIVTISMADNGETVEVCIIDLMGRKIYNSGVTKLSNLKLNISEYSKGVYIINIRRGLETVIKKLIIE